MTTYTIQANNESQSTPVLKRGRIQIYTTVPIYYMIAEWPEVDTKTCAVIPAGEFRDIVLKTKCNRIAVQAVKDSGTVTITEKYGGARSSCSA